MTSEETMSSIIYLVRHGQTIGNVEQIIKDPATDNLTKEGEDQALRLGDHFSDVKLTRIYCSTLLRAVETIKIAKERFQNAPKTVVYDPRIREIEDRPFIGKPYSAKNLVWGKGMDEKDPLFDYVEFHAKDCEPVGEIFARQDSFFEDLFYQLDRSETPESAFVLTHGVLIRFMMKYFMLSDKYEVQILDPEYTSLVDGLKNCSYHKFEVSKRGKDHIGNKSSPRIVKFLQLNQTEHLQDE